MTKTQHPMQTAPVVHVEHIDYSRTDVLQVLDRKEVR